MCGCNHQTGLRCDFHQQMDAITSRSALRFLSHLRDHQAWNGLFDNQRPAPIHTPTYIERIRAGVD